MRSRHACAAPLKVSIRRRAGEVRAPVQRLLRLGGRARLHAKIDPEAWKIVDAKLYLNYSKDVQADWAEDIPGNISKGDANWPKIHADLAG